MAGRGTDIMLGGNVDFVADQALRKQGMDPADPESGYEEAWADAVAAAEAQVKSEHEEVVELGGLAVIGTERHESRRIDNQLRGRSGRQGDPGSSQFYLSLQDDLMRLFKSDWVDWVLTRMNIPDDVPIENKRVTGAIASAQAQVESQNFETRKNILKYDDVMSRQREVVYAERRKVLEGEDLADWVRDMIEQVVTAYVAGATEGFSEEWDLEALWSAVGTLYPVTVTVEEVEEEAGGRDKLSRESLTAALVEDALAAYARREEELTEPVTREAERLVVLSVLDRKWREHLYEMDYLREGIGLRAYSQRDPLIEYQREGFDLFTAMMEATQEEAVGYLFNVEVNVQAPEGAGAEGEAVPQVSAKGVQPQQEQKLAYSAPTEAGEAEVRTESSGDDSASNAQRAQNNAKNKARQKAKQQRKSRKSNR
jgi:preprotein translocase subunit SecA